MSDLVTRTAKLTPYAKRAKSQPGFATAYYYEPEPGEDAGLGNLYVIVEVLAAAKQSQEVADLIIQAFGEAYYNRTNAPDEQLERFEASIKAVNQELADYTNQGNAGWVGRISAIIAVLTGDELHLTQTGSAEAFLYRGEAATHISEGLAPKGPHRPISTFGHIASGSLHQDDRLLLTTPALLHHLDKDRLKQTVVDSTANAAATKISEMVAGSDAADRLAAVIIEVTTPEALASQALPEEPEAVQVGQPENVISVAREAALPVAKEVHSRAKSGAKSALEVWRTKVMPRLKPALLGAAGWMRKNLATKRGRQAAIAVAAVLLLFAGFSTLAGSRSKELDTLVGSYDQAVSGWHQAQILNDNGNKDEARTQLQTAKAEAEKLQKSPRLKQLETRLAQREHPEDDPVTVGELIGQINALLDQLDGLTHVSPTELFAFTEDKPEFIEQVGNRIVMTTGGDTTKIYVYDLGASRVSTSSPQTNPGKVVATAVNTAGDGVFLLTAEPAVWLFKPDTNSLAKQAISFGEWPRGKDLASYAGNLYVLADDQVWRHTPTAAGFSGRSGYFTAGAAEAVSGSSVLAVDGSVLLSGSTLRRFVAGKQEQAAEALPDTLKNPRTIQSATEGSMLLLADSQSKRVGVISFDGKTLSPLRQFNIKDTGELKGAVLDTKTRTVYILTGDKLAKFGLVL